MKIIFDSIEEKDEFIDYLVYTVICPNRIRLKETCDGQCRECWEDAVKEIAEVADAEM